MLSRIKNRGLGKSIIAVMFCMILTIVLSSVNSVKVYAASEVCEHCGGNGKVCYNHSYEISSGKDSRESCSKGTCGTSISCSKHGNSPYGYECPFCKGTGIKHQKVEHHEAVEASCTEAGNVEYWECTGCKNYIDEDYNVIADVTIAAKGHTKGTHHEAVEVTCTEDGNVEYWECSECDKYIGDNLKVITNVTIVAKGSHDFSEYKYEDSSVHKRECSACGFIEEKDHNISKYECLDYGRHGRKCKFCDYSIKENHNLIDRKCEKCEYEKTIGGTKPEGQGDKSNPYLISNVDELVWFRDTVNVKKRANALVYAQLTADIDLSSVCGEDIGSWEPIGINEVYPFYGKFNGDGHKITNLYIKDTDGKDYLGLFGYAFDPTFSDLTVEGVVTGSGNYYGILQGYGYSSYAEYCRSYGEVMSTGSGSYVGGMGGHIGSAECCENYANVSGEEYVGGLAGEANKVEYSLNAGDLNARKKGYTLGAVQNEIVNCLNVSKPNENITENATFYGYDGAEGDNAFTAEQVESGYAAYTVQANVGFDYIVVAGHRESVWGQKIGEQKNPVPLGPKVYRTGPCVSYSNKTSKKEHKTTVEYICESEVTCDDCGESFGGSHVETRIGSRYNATCTSDGNTEGIKCSRCGEILEEQEIIPALGHDIVHVEEKEPTIYEDGNYEYWKCSRCTEGWADEDCEEWIYPNDMIKPRLEYIRDFLKDYSDVFEIVDTEGYWLPSDDGYYQIMSDVGKPITGQGYRCRIILRAKKYCKVRIRALIKKDCKFEVTDKAGAHSYSSQSNLYYLNKGGTFYIDCISKTKDGAGVYWKIANLYVDEDPPSISEASLALGSGDVAANFYFKNISDYIGSKGDQDYVEINSKKYYYNEIIDEIMQGNGDWKRAGDNIWIYSCHVPAKAMNDPIEIRMCNFEGKIIPFANETTDEDGVFRYSVNDYLNSAINSEESSEELKALARAMQNYGLCAQDYFGYNAPATTPAIDDNVDYSDFDIIKEGTLPEGVEYVGSSLILESNISIRHYFRISDREDVTFAVNDTVITPEVKDGLSYIEIRDIKPTDLAKAYTVTVSDSDNTYSFDYSAMSYCKKANSTSSDSKLKNLAYSLYWYNKAALGYFNQ